MEKRKASQTQSPTAIHLVGSQEIIDPSEGRLIPCPPTFHTQQDPLNTEKRASAPWTIA